MPTHLVVMGVAGTGKTTVAERLAGILGLPTAEGDDFHPGSNRDKMSAGIPLVDDDRWPWLDAVGAELADGRAQGGRVIACSALRRVYRDRLRAAVPDLRFVHLDGSAELLQERASARTGHYMPPSLLPSQLALLEPLEPDEPGLVLDVSASVEELVAQALAWIG